MAGGRGAGAERGAHPPGPGVPGPGVLGRITVTVPVMLLGEPPPATQGYVDASPGLAAALRAILAAGAATAREAGRADSDHADNDHADGAHRVPCLHANSPPGYRVPDWMRDLIEVRDQDCGFPICRRPASRCDLDHTVPYDQGGLTCPCNISGLCRVSTYLPLAVGRCAGCDGSGDGAYPSAGLPAGNGWPVGEGFAETASHGFDHLGAGPGRGL